MKNWSHYVAYAAIIIIGVCLFSLLHYSEPIKIKGKVDASVRITDQPVVSIPLENTYNKPLGDILKLNPNLDPAVAEQIAEAVKDSSKKYGIPEELIIAIMLKESSFNITAVSEAKCVGLMQVNPDTWKEEIKNRGWNRSQVFHIHNNVDLGTWIFKQYYEKAESVQKALVNYLGALNTKYVLDILDTYANLTVSIVEEPEE